MVDETDKTFIAELERLEKRIDSLVDVCDQLKEENKSLRARQDTLTAERANLLQKNEQVRARVEAMVSRLKAMEHGS
jgi:cell division protein ZapB